MMNVYQFTNIFSNARKSSVGQIREWAETVFCGGEFSLFLVLLWMLMNNRKMSVQEIAQAIPGEVAELPWEGCEQQAFESIIAALRERGQDDEAICEIVETIGSFLHPITQFVEEPQDSPFPGFRVGPIAEA